MHPTFLPRGTAEKMTSTTSGCMALECGHRPRSIATKAGKGAEEILSNRMKRLGTGVAAEAEDRRRKDQGEFCRRVPLVAVFVQALDSLRLHCTVPPAQTQNNLFSHARI